MALQFSTTLRNAMLEAIESSLGTAAKVRAISGSQPANCATAQSGTQIAEWTLASDWSAAASGGTKSLSSTPLSTTASASATAGYFRLVDNAGTTCHMQGSLGTSGTDLIIDNAAVTSGQTVQITSWTWTAPGA